MANIARANGSTIVATATPVQFYGRELQFIAVVVKNVSGTAQSLSGEFGPEAAITQINTLITAGTGAAGTPVGGSSILAVQYDATGQLSYILDGSVGNWTYSTLQTAIRGLGTVNSIDCSGTTVTDVGFKLALS